MFLKVEKVSKYYGSQKALDSLSFQIDHPGIVGFLGPNGAGKSTMMKIITGFLPFEEGQVEVLKMNVREHSMKIKSRLGYLPEHNPLYTDMYVKEFLEFCARIYRLKNPMQRVKEMISLTGLEKEQHKKIRALSKGYRQRVGLAQAMIHQPDVLILDEPTSGLDPNQIQEIRQLLQNFAKEKLILFSTHIMQEVEILCREVIIIHQGKKIMQGPVSLIKTHTSGQILEIEIQEPVEESFWQGIPELTSVRKITPNAWMLIFSSEEDVRKKIFDYCVQRNITLLSLQKKQAGMDEVFRKLTHSVQ
jgi:ABC-2 type transport system ATP-binding protein